MKLSFRRKWLIFTLGPVLLLLAVLLLTGESILYAIGDWLVAKDDDLQPADMIHILGGGLDRVDYGIKLHHQTHAPRLFITSCHSITYKERAMAAGVPQEDIFPDSTLADSTFEEAQELKEFLDQAPSIRSVIIVSNPYHMRRAQWSFNKVLGDRVTLQFAPVPFEMTPFEHRWWTDGKSRNMVVKEYAKILVYFVKYGLR